MKKNVVLFLLGRMALLNGLALLIPLLYVLWSGEPGWHWFGSAAVSAIGAGLVLIYAGRQRYHRLDVVEGAWYLVLLWGLLCVVGMIPYAASGRYSLTDAFFESAAAYTTTGISSLSPLAPALPASLLVWHSFMEWLGGLNFILLLVTIIPQVSGCFGLTLSAHQRVRFSPVIGRMEGAAWKTGKIYIAITILSVMAYSLAGLAPLDAWLKACMTVSTSGGDRAFDFIRYENPALEAAGAVSMILASGNFLLYWKCLERKQIRDLVSDMELRVFFALLAGAGLLVSFHLWRMGIYDWVHSLRFGFFQVLSFSSTSGFFSADAARWPEFDQFILFILVFLGGCIGSATGGLRIMRGIVLFKIAKQEMRRTLHPHMVIRVKIDGMPVEMKIISRVLSYFFLFIAVFFVSSVIISLTGVTPLQAMGIAIGCLSSAGGTIPLFGITDISLLPAWAKWYCSLLMILGRIEIFSLFIVLQTTVQYIRRRW